MSSFFGPIIIMVIIFLFGFLINNFAIYVFCGCMAGMVILLVTLEILDRREANKQSSLDEFDD